MANTTFERQAISETLSQFHGGRVHDPDFDALRRFPRSSVNIILDVGANRGQALASLRTIFADAPIHAFEANPMFFSVLDAVVDRIGGPLTVHRSVLVANRRGCDSTFPWWVTSLISRKALHVWTISRNLGSRRNSRNGDQ